MTSSPARSGRITPAVVLLFVACACGGTEPPSTSGAGSAGVGQSGAGASSAGSGGVSGAGGSSGGQGGAATGGTAGTATGAGSGGVAGGVAGNGATAGAMTSGGMAGASGTAGGGGSAAGSGGADAGGAGSGGTGNGGAGSGGLASGGAGTGNTAGVAGTSGTAGTGGTSAYRPCPTDGSDCKVLPLGDSITFGVGDEANGGYRGPLFAAAISAGKKLTFTGSLMNGPTMVMNQAFPKRNEGHSGWGIVEETPYSGGNAGIIITIPTPAMSSGSGGIPHIVLLHIGTNDSSFFTANEMTEDLAELLDQIIMNAPDALVVVAQIVPLGYGTNDVIRSYNQSIPDLVEARASAGKHVVLVDMFTGFNASSMIGSDSVHPNASGYDFMADRWYGMIGELLP